MWSTLFGGVMGAAIVTVLGGGVIAWLRYRRKDAADVEDTEASAAERRANAASKDLEAWEQMRALRTGLVADLTLVQNELTAMRAEYRAALAHIVEVHEWDAKGRKGPMPAAPADVALVQSSL